MWEGLGAGLNPGLVEREGGGVQMKREGLGAGTNQEEKIERGEGLGAEKEGGAS